MSTTPKRRRTLSAAVAGMAAALNIKPKKKTNDWRTFAVADSHGKPVGIFFPDSNRAVLCLTRSGNQFLGYFVRGSSPAASRWVSVTGDTMDVTHWREL